MSSSHPLRAWQVSLGGICGLVITLGLARFAYTPLLPTLQAQTGLSDASAGLLAAINYAGYMTGALVFSWLDDARWRHRLYSLGLWLAIVVTALMAWTDWLPAWALWRYVGGFCGATGMLLGSGLVMGWLLRHDHRPELGVYFMGIGLGILVTAVGSELFMALWQDWRAHWLAFAALGLVFGVFAWRWRPPLALTTSAGAAQTAAPQVSRRWMWTLIASYFTAGWGFVISATFTVAIVERAPALAGRGPLAWALVGVAALPVVFLWDRIARRLGDVRALMLAFVLQIGTVVLPAVSDSLWAALGNAVGYGATFIGIVSLTLAMVGRRAPSNPGKAMARLTLSYGAAQIVAPVVTGLMAQASGGRFGTALWLTAAVMTLGLGLLATLPRQD